MSSDQPETVVMCGDVRIACTLLRRLPRMVIVGARSVDAQDMAERIRSQVTAAGFEFPRTRVLLTLSWTRAVYVLHIDKARPGTANVLDILAIDPAFDPLNAVNHRPAYVEPTPEIEAAAALAILVASGQVTP